jgi:Type VI secretion system/phage-baseplate injector OB domain
MMNYAFVDGVVVDTNDPQQDGRIRVWCPGIDGDSYVVDNLPWAKYVSQLAGQTRDYPAGSRSAETQGLMSYGFWAVPKVGATVVVGLLYNNKNKRFYLGSFFQDHGNRSLPTGRNRPDLGVTTPVSDTFDPVQPQTSNLQAQFQGNVNAPEARTRGAYERMVAQDKTIKDGTEGYYEGVVDKGLDPQTYCFTTPGRHSLIFQDNPENSRIRLKTADGHQIIFDDANERIYISTARGNSWVELDSDGHIHIHAGESLSMATGGDFNVTAAGSINMKAGGSFNVSASGSARVSACGDLSLNGNGLNLESSGAMNFLAAGDLLQTGSSIHLNGPTAPSAPCAVSPSLIPAHEPWVRPMSKIERNRNWKR